MLAVTSITFFIVADVKCGLHEINKNNRTNAICGPSLVQQMFRDQTEVMLDRRGPGPASGPVLTLIITVTIVTSISFSFSFFLLWGG